MDSSITQVEQVKKDIINFISEIEKDERFQKESLITQFKEAFFSLHPSDQAELITDTRGEKRRLIIEHTLVFSDSEILFYLEKQIINEILEIISIGSFGKMLIHLKSHDIVSIIQELSSETVSEILSTLNLHKRAQVSKILLYPEGSAGRFMHTDFLSVKNTFQIKEVMHYLQVYKHGKGYEQIEPEIFVQDSDEKLVGKLSAIQLFKLKPEQIAQHCAEKIIFNVTPEIDIEDVIHLFIKYDLKTLPVIDSSSKMLGVIELSRITHLANSQTEEDLLNILGVFGSETSGIFSTAKTRFIWLFINLLTAILASSFIGIFESSIANYATLAVLLPITASMGGNCATQSSAIILRSIATRTFHKSIFIDEISVALINATSLSVLCFFFVASFYSNTALGLAFGASIFITLLSAGFFGGLLPIIINKIKLDPAIVTTVFLTTVTDVIGFFSFLTLSKLLLKI